MYRVFIIEDEETIARGIQKQMESWSLEAKCVQDFRSVMEEFQDYQPHLVLLDISLPFYNGYYWCQEIRKISKVPVIFLSSASENMNIVMAIQMGGDDFIAKPFDYTVMTAKIQAVLRRAYDYTMQPSALEHRGAVLNTQDATLLYEGKKIDLTRNEYRILQTLLEQKDRIVSRERLMEKLWESDSFVDENTLSVNVNRLRKKLEQEGLDHFITTKVGMGYLIEKKGEGK